MAQGSARRLTWRTTVMALVAVISAFSVAGLLLPAASASAATKSIDQCNGFNGSATGATTALTCTVTVVNTISGARTFSGSLVPLHVSEHW
jgi:hypothetical protein